MFCWWFPFPFFFLAVILSSRSLISTLMESGAIRRQDRLRTIYFDYNATTPLDPLVREAMLPLLGDVWGNPSSLHHVGQQSRALLDDARDHAAVVLGCSPNEIIFTSGGTESNNLAIFGMARLLAPKGKHIITSTIEHHAVLQCFDCLEKREGFSVTRLPVDKEGRVSPEDLKKSFRPDSTFVSVMAANNEIGTIQPVAELGALCRERGIVFHTDAVQWFGKEPFACIQQFNADLVSLCAHKFHGPKGAGLLFVRSPLLPHPILFGGGHEHELRAGTENLAGITGLTRALELFVPKPVFADPKIFSFASDLTGFIKSLPAVRFVGSLVHRLPNTVSFVVEGVDGISLMAGLDIEGICASSGSACVAGSHKPSHVIKALGLDPLSLSLVRLSLGRENSSDEVNLFKNALPEILLRLRKFQ
jgi:cysteine desulfurase